jgi:hypothetical protein
MARHIYVVGRAHRDLYEFLSKQFEDDGNVKVILDRRLGERRRSNGQTAKSSPERRQRIDRRSRPLVDEELKLRSHAVVSLPDSDY